MSAKFDNSDREDDSGYERTPSPASQTIVAKQNAKTIRMFKSTDHRRSSGRNSDTEKQANASKVPDIGRKVREAHAATSSSTTHTTERLSEVEVNHGRVASEKRDRGVLGVRATEAERRMDTVVPTKKERKDSGATCQSSSSSTTSASVEEVTTIMAEGIPETSVTPTSDACSHTMEGDPDELRLFYSRPICSNRPTYNDYHKSLRMFLSTRKAFEAVEKIEESPALRTALLGETVPDPYGALRLYRTSQSHSTIRRPPQ